MPVTSHYDTSLEESLEQLVDVLEWIADAAESGRFADVGRVARSSALDARALLEGPRASLDGRALYFERAR